MFENVMLDEYVKRLASGDAVPGGGGASAVVGSLGSALSSMVANLTSGKKKFAEFQPEIDKVLEDAAKLCDELMALSEKDAEVFYPLSKAYGIPKDDPGRDEVLEKALKLAAGVPFEIMEKCLEALSLHERLLGRSSKLAVSDIGTGAAFVKGALEGAFLNVTVNTRLMKDRDYAAELNAKAQELLESGRSKAEEIYGEVEKQLWT